MKGLQNAIFLFVILLVIAVLLIPAFYSGLYNIVKEYVGGRTNVKLPDLPEINPPKVEPKIPTEPTPLNQIIPQSYYDIFTRASKEEGTSIELITAIFKCGEHPIAGGCPSNKCRTDNPDVELKGSWPGHKGPWASSEAGANGPFQFISSTWERYKRDGNGDGFKDVQNLEDAAYGASAYLKACSGTGRDSSKSQEWNKAWCYNHDSNYATKVDNCYKYLKAEKPSGKFTWPVPSFKNIYQRFVNRPGVGCPQGGCTEICRDVGGKNCHYGLDIPAAWNSEIHSVADGTVTDVVTNCEESSRTGANSRERTCGNTYGNNVIILHDDSTYSAYAHIRLGGVVVSKGERVSAGQRIGFIGNTGSSGGSHLHFVMGTGGTPGINLGGPNPIDPCSVLKC